jgi:serine phosphatase RsbU (regulator of sigma subunit)
MDPRGDFFGLERLRATGRAYLASPMQRLCDGVVDAVAAYRGTAPQADDITLLALRVWSAS